MRETAHRRAVLRATGTLAATTALGGCVGDGGTPTRDGTTSTGTAVGTTGGPPGSEQLREELGLRYPDYDVEDALRVYQWTGYWPERTVTDFEEAFDVEVTVDTYVSNEAMFDTLQREGTDAYDLVFPSDYMVSQLVGEGMLRPLDLEKIPNWENLKRRWVEQAPYDPGPERYSAPYQWGTTGIAWHDGLVESPPLTSWDAMWDDAYAGNMTMLNDPRETMAAALKRLGYSLNTRDSAEIQEAKEALIRQKDLLRTYTSTGVGEKLQNRFASPMHAWSGDALIAYWALYGDGSSPIGYRIPAEGGVVWVDTAAITAGARHPNAAHLFVNYVLNAKVNAYITNWVYYATPNEAAEQYLDESLLNNESIYPPEEVRDRLEFIRDVGDAVAEYERAWQAVKDA